MLGGSRSIEHLAHLGGQCARGERLLASGEKRTVLVLDKAGGGIRLSVIE